MKRFAFALALSLIGVVVVAPALRSQAADPGTAPLRPGDLIEVAAWRDTMLSGRFPVDEHGRVLLPLLGERLVTHAPWAAVRDTVLADYSRQLRAGEIRVTPRRRVYVLGFAGEPGVYFAEPAAGLATVVAMAGGAAPDGDLRRVRVVRDGQELWTAAAVESAQMRQPVQSGDQIFIGRRGWFDRNAPFFVNAMVSLAGIVVTLLIAR